MGSLFSGKGCLVIFITLCFISAIVEAFRSCSSSNTYNDFEEAIGKGNLSEAKDILKDGTPNEDAALQLIKAYLDVGEGNAAIDVYENITRDHDRRDNLQYKPDSYSSKACKMLREYLLQHGQYNDAWNYYPLDYPDENSYINAKCRFTWMSDVVSELCKKGRQDDARRFVDDQVRWFTINVDQETYESSENVKATFNSQAVLQNLYNQIDNVH